MYVYINNRSLIEIYCRIILYTPQTLNCDVITIYFMSDRHHNSPDIQVTNSYDNSLFTDYVSISHRRMDVPSNICYSALELVSTL